MTASCPVCNATLVPGAAGGEAERGTVGGTLDGPATWRCPDGHTTIAADLDAAVEEVHDAIDVAERTLLRGTLRCALCSTPYRLPGRRVTRSVTLTASGLPATRLTLDLPMLRCTEDAVESLPPECVDDLDGVLAELLGADT